MKSNEIDRKLDLEKRLEEAKQNRISYIATCDINNLRRIAAQKKNDHSIYLGQNKMWIDFNPDYNKEEIDKLAKEAEDAAKNVDDAERKLNALKGEIAELESQISQLDYEASKKDVLEWQVKVTSLEEEIAKIQEIIVTYEDDGEDLLNTAGDQLAILTEKKESILAGLALGEVTDKKQLETIDRQIAAEEKMHSEAVDSRIKASQAVKGLQAKIACKIEELSTARKNYSEVLSAFLIRERRLAGETYVKMALEFAGLFRKIAAMDKLLENFSPSQKALNTSEARAFKIPKINNPACQAIGGPASGNFIFRLSDVNLRNECDELKKEFSESGIKFF